MMSRLLEYFRKEYDFSCDLKHIYGEYGVQSLISEVNIQNKETCR
jgi:hypothetical protein